MVENGTWRRSGAAFKLLFFLEGLQANRAETVIAVTAAMRGYMKEKYGAVPARFFVKPSCVDFEHFKRKDGEASSRLKRELGLEGKLVCVYAGKIGGLYLEGEIFDFLRAAHDHWGGKFAALLLTDASDEKVRALCERSGLPLTAIVKRYVQHRLIPAYLEIADFALTPVRPVPSKRFGTSIKDGEYWAMGLPVVITAGISDDSDIIADNKIGSVIRDLTPDSYLRSVKEIDGLLNPSEKPALAKKIRDIAKRYRDFEKAKEIYRDIYG